jgi:uncharacterized membrane protein
MRKLMIAAFALSALAFGAMVAAVQADDLRAAPRRNGDECLRYSPDNYREGRFGRRADCPQPSKLARPSQAVGRATTCTQMKSACLIWAPYYGVPRYQDPFCDLTWEHCMKTGWWEGPHVGRQVERR